MDTTLFIGIIGATSILIAFILNQIGTWKRNALAYDATNTLGSALLVIYAYQLSSYPFLVLNTIWLVVSVKDTLAHLLQK